MPRFTIHVERLISETASVTVTAASLEEALAAAVDKASADDTLEWTADDEWAGPLEAYAAARGAQLVWER